MDTNQIYAIVNEVNAEAFGSTDIDVVDAQGLVALGDAVLSSTGNTEAFLNTLVQRIGKTIISFRQYRNKLADMVVDDFEYGAILQKIRVHLTEAERKAIPYIILANQFVCVAWFAEQDKYAEILETNKQMTQWLIRNFEALGSI